MSKSDERLVDDIWRTLGAREQFIRQTVAVTCEVAKDGRTRCFEFVHPDTGEQFIGEITPELARKMIGWANDCLMENMWRQIQCDQPLTPEKRHALRTWTDIKLAESEAAERDRNDKAKKHRADFHVIEGARS